MARIIGKGYSYDDVLIVPKYNKIFSRREVNFKTKVTRNYEVATRHYSYTVLRKRLNFLLGNFFGIEM